jgi:hypothetical protein
MEISGLFSLIFHSIRHALGRMCGRYRRKSDEQRIADDFTVEELDLDPNDDIALQPMVPWSISIEW